MIAASMKRITLLVLGLLIGFCVQATVCHAQTDYPLTADSQPQADVPRGEVKGPFQFRSQIYPGTIRNYWIYVPAGYDGDKKTCLLVVQDGIGRANEWRLPTVMDNLIHNKEIPPTLGLFIDHGQVPPVNEGGQPRFNRSFEYDSMGDRYAKFLVEEMLPQLRKKYPFSDNPSDRAIAGASSGGICAFNVAWERPDQFRRVICTIGTFVGLRGGDAFSTLVRKTEAKPIRVFLQDGSNDLDIYAGGWWTANQGMLAALEWAGYDVKHVWGDGGHNGVQGAAVMPDALRWLWRDYPQDVNVDPDAAAGRRMKVVRPAENWEAVESLSGATAVSSDAEGKVRSEDADSSHELSLHSKVMLSWDPSTGTISVTANQSSKQTELVGVSGLAVSPDQQWVWASQGNSRFVTHYLLAGDELKYGQVYGDLHVNHNQSDCQAGAMLTDQDGNLLVATNLGIQVLDPLGRVNFIVRPPNSSPISDMCWGGEKRNQLYVVSDGKVFRRKLQLTGTDSEMAPSKPPKPGL